MHNKQRTACFERNVVIQEKTGLHARYKHGGRYDFQQLAQTCPDLAQFLSINKYKVESIDFSNPAAVKSLNKAVFKQFHGVTQGYTGQLSLAGQITSNISRICSAHAIAE